MLITEDIFLYSTPSFIINWNASLRNAHYDLYKESKGYNLVSRHVWMFLCLGLSPRSTSCMLKDYTGMFFISILINSSVALFDIEIIDANFPKKCLLTGFLLLEGM